MDKIIELWNLYGILVVCILWGISEGLAASKTFESNSVFQLVRNALIKLKDFVLRK